MCRSYPRLEGLLDWLLSIYKFVFPFLVISAVAKLSGGDHGSDHVDHMDDHGDHGHTSPLLLRGTSGLPALERGGSAAGAGLGRRASGLGQQSPLQQQQQEGQEEGALGLDKLPSRLLSEATSLGELGRAAPRGLRGC